MAWSYTAIAAAIHDGGTTAPNLINQMSIAIADVAIDVMSEGAGVTNHTLRYAFATKVVNEGVRQVAVIMADVIGEQLSRNGASAPPGGPTDAEVKTATAAVWNLFAGA